MPGSLDLRTILLYLDDNLEPTRARDVGQRIAQDPRLGELIQRIRTVVRRRRLVAHDPRSDVADVNANDVAEYLDGRLSIEQEAAFEREALESDLTLAELASVSQILSMEGGEPISIPDSERERLYRIGGLGEPAPRSRPARPAIDPSLLESQSIPIGVPRWTVASGRSGQWVTFLVVVALTAALAVSMSKTLSPRGEWAQTPVDGNGPGPSADAALAKPPLDRPAVAAPEPKIDPAPALPREAGEAPIVIEATIPDEPVVVDAEMEKALASAAPVAPPEKRAPTAGPDKVAVGSAATKTDAAPERPAPLLDREIPVASFPAKESILFRRDRAGLELVKGPAFLYAGDEVINVDGLRSRLELPEKATIELVDLTRLGLRFDGRNGFSGALSEGRMVVSSGERPLKLDVALGGLDAKSSRGIAIELSGRDQQACLETIVAEPLTADSAATDVVRLLVVSAIRGEVTVAAGGVARKFTGGYQVLCSPTSVGEPRAIKSSVAWLTRRPTASEAKAAVLLAEAMGANGRVGMTLRESLHDRNRDVRRLSVRCLAAVEDHSGLASALNSREHADVRQTAIEAARALLRREPDKLGAFRAALLESLDEESADEALVLLLGYSAAAQKKVSTYELLIDRLDSARLLVRELAIFNLQELTGRDLQYAADASAMRRKSAIANWRRWLASQTPETLPPARPERSSAPRRGRPLETGGRPARSPIAG